MNPPDQKEETRSSKSIRKLLKWMRSWKTREGIICHLEPDEMQELYDYIRSLEKQLNKANTYKTRMEISEEQSTAFFEENKVLKAQHREGLEKNKEIYRKVDALFNGTMVVAGFTPIQKTWEQDMFIIPKKQLTELLVSLPPLSADHDE